MMPAFGGKPKKLHATVTLKIAAIEADSQRFQTYDFDEMMKKYKEELESEFEEVINVDHGWIEAESIDAVVQVKDG
jgi:hypothetical protein